MVQFDGSGGLMIKFYAFAAKGSQLISAIIIITFLVVLQESLLKESTEFKGFSGIVFLFSYCSLVSFLS